MRRLSARSLRSRSDDAPVNPMDSISNLADAMLVLAVGIMLALIINWNVDISSAGQTADTPADPAISFVQDDLTESQSSAGTIEGDLTEMGKVYYDKRPARIILWKIRKRGMRNEKAAAGAAVRGDAAVPAAA